MEFFLLDVKSTININGKGVAFDYINTYTNLDETLVQAETLVRDNNVLDVSIHRWVLKEDGTQEHAEDVYINGVFKSSIPYTYTNIK